MNIYREKRTETKEYSKDRRMDNRKTEK